ncbi:MAG: hypothetical protein AB1402_07380 [Bacillota bacterium]
MRSLKRSKPIPALLLAGMMLAGLLLAAAGCGFGGPAPNGSTTPPDRNAAPEAPSGTAAPLPPPLEWPATGTPAPAFRLPSLIGGEVSLPDDFQGRAVMLLFFSLG